MALQAVLGFAVAAVSPFLYGFGLVVAFVLYFVVKQHYPAFAVGMLVGFCTLLALLLGLLGTCLMMWQGARS